jgi:hypothetical protein
MNDEMIRSLGWVGLAVGIGVVALFLEVLLRTLINRRGETSDTTLQSGKQ